MEVNADNVKEVIESVLASPSMSHWIKTALLTTLQRDPVDATNDAQLLADILAAHCERFFRMHAAFNPNEHQYNPITLDGKCVECGLDQNSH